MSISDAVTLANRAVMLGLVTEAQVLDVWEELGQRGGEAPPFLRTMERKGYLTPWQTHKLNKGDGEGYFLGGYRILYRIASGTFGRVFRADDPQTGRVVAIKVLRRRWSEDKHNIDLFAREGRLGLSLHHPNIVEVLAVSFDPVTQSHFIVMEFVEGPNLRDLLAARKKIEPAEALRITEETAAGLAYAFSRGVTHRDMKLTNILISTQGTAKLVDFGLAGIYHAVGQRDDGQVDRTVDYAGLEKATGVPPGDVRSDIFFLGCVLYEILSGRPPLSMPKSKSMRMQRDRFMNIPALKPPEVQGPPSLFRLVATMTSLEPRLRFQTPSQLLDAVRDVRRDVEGREPADRQGAPGVSAAPPPARSVFVVEQDVRLQNALRGKFKSLGYRVFLSGDPVRALDRYRQQPFDSLVVNASTVGEEGLLLFERVMAEADKLGAPCAGVIVLGEDQADWVERVTKRPTVAVLVRPVTLKQLYHKMEQLMQRSEAHRPV
jgi:serine/threonine protein kinase